MTGVQTCALPILGLDAQDLLDVLHQLKGVAGFAVHLVDEGKDGDVALGCTGQDLFPAYAGVIPKQNHKGPVETAFPRTRGGDPQKCEIAQKLIDFSPHTRG